MIQQFPRTWPLLLLLLVAALPLSVFDWRAWHDLHNPMKPPTIAPGRTSPEVSLPEVQTPLPSLDAHVHVAFAERPLFSPTRKPPALSDTEDAVAPKNEPQLPAFLLTGVIYSKGIQIALIQPATATDSQRVKIGDTVDGWTLARLSAHGALFRQAGLEQEVHLDFAMSNQHSDDAQAGQPNSSR